MSIHVSPHILLRAPLLRARDIKRPAALLESPFGKAGLALASPDLAAALAAGSVKAQARQAVSRYASRAAFRPTPSGFLAGVTLGELAARTAVATGTPTFHLRPSWARLAALGRALLDEPAVRKQVKLRVAPSLLAVGSELAWLAFDEPSGLTTRHAESDETLSAVLLAAENWTP